MSFTSWLHSLKSTIQSYRMRSSRRSRPHRRLPGYRIRLEVLEDRLAPAVVTWTGAAGDFNWDTAANWSSGAVPGAADDAVIDLGPNNFTVTHSSGAADSVRSLNDRASLALSGGTLTVAAATTISGTFNLSNGATFAGSGNTTIGGLFTWSNATLHGIASAGSLTAAGGMAISGSDVLDGLQLNNSLGQTATWNGNLVLQNGAVFDNYGTVDNQSDSGMSGDALAAFNNYGTFVKSAAGGYPQSSTIGVALNNYGTVDLQKGVLELGYGGAPVVSSGTILGSSSTLLEFEGPSTFTAATSDHVSINTDAVAFYAPGPSRNATVAGHYRAKGTELGGGFNVAFTGTVDNFGSDSGYLVHNLIVNGGATLDLTAATLAPGAATLSGLTLSNATVIGADNFTVTGLFSDGGTLWAKGGAGSLTALGGIYTSPSVVAVFDGYTLTNAVGQTAVWTGNMVLQNGAVLNNYGTVDAQDDAGMSGDALAVFNNYGTFVKSAANGGYPFGTDIAVAFNNYGTVDDQKGVLNLGVGGAPVFNSGTILAAVGADPSTRLGRLTLLEFLGPSTFTAATADHVSIYADFVAFYAPGRGFNATVAGHYRANGTEVIGNINVAFTGTVDSLGSGLFAFALYVDHATVDLTAATLAPGAATLSNLILSYGTLIAPQNLTVTSPFIWSNGTLRGNNGYGSLTVQGGMTISGDVSAYDFGFINPATTTWTGGTVCLYGADSSFTNTATGIFDDQVDGTFGNCDGNCANFVNQGLFLKSGGSGTTNLQMDLVNSGRVVIQNGSLNLGCGYVQAPSSGGGSGGTISGTFTGTISNPGQLDLVPAPTPPPVVTAYTQTVTGILNEQIGGLRAGTQYGQIAVTGSVNLAGTLHVLLINGFTPHLNDQFVIIDNQGSNAINGTFAGLPEGALINGGGYQFQISYIGGNGNDVVLTARQAATTTVLASTANSSVFGQAVTFTATVSAGAGTPTGSVDFRDTTANVDLGIVNVSGGAAMLSTSALAVGTHVITASYSGAPAFVASSGTLTETVNKDATTTAVASSLNPSAYGQGVTFTATVTASAPGSGMPTGTVSFYYDSIDAQHQIGQQKSLSNGSATSPAISSLSASGHTIYAVYSGDGNFNNGQGSLTQTVLSAQQQIALIGNQVNALVSAGALGSGNGIALKAKLNSATASLNAGNTTAGVNQLNAFINQVTAFQKTGKLGTAQAQALISAANQAIASASGSSGAHLMNDSSAGTSTSTDNLPISNVAQLVTGTVGVYFTDSTGNITADEQGRFDDALNTLNATFGTYGVALVEVSAAADAIVQVAIAATSPAGSAADGVLGCTVAGQITLVTGWNWYTGAAPSAIGAGQYDFQTIVTHELGHAVGLGHSGDTGSVMYAYLAPGQARRGVTTQDLSVLDTDAGRTPEPLTAAPWHDHQASAQPAWPALIDRPQTPGTSNRAGEQGGIALFEMVLGQTRFGPWLATASVDSSPLAPLHGSLSAIPHVAEAKSAQTSSTPDHHAVGKAASRAVDEVFAGWFADAREEELWGRLR